MSGGTSFDVSPTGGITKIVFQIPNRSGSFWAANYTQFVGNITVNVTSTNGADTYALIQPQVDLTASLHDSYLLTCAGVQTARNLNMDQNLLNISIQANALDDNAYSIYGTIPYSGGVAPAPVPFRNYLNYQPKEFFAPGNVPFREVGTEQAVLVPAFLSGIIQLELYLRPADRYVSTNPAFVPLGTLTAHAHFDDVHLEILYIESPSLLQNTLKNGWVVQFDEAEYQEVFQPAVPAGARNTQNIPGSFRMSNYILSIIQRPTDATVLAVPQRNRLASPELTALQNYQIKVNSKTIYDQDLNMDDVYLEMIRANPLVAISSWIAASTFPPLNFLWFSTHQILYWILARDYISDEYLSGISSNLMVAGLQLIYAYTGAIMTPSTLRCWLYHTNLAVLEPGRTYLEIIR